MIHIKSQDGMHQYDECGNAITTWNDKCCNWIVNDEYVDAYNNDEIDWWGRDNDFPRGCSMEYYIRNYGDPNSHPDISLEMIWATKEDYQKMNPRYDEYPDYYPYRFTRSWGYLNYSEQEAIESLVTNKDSYYNSVAKGSTGCKLYYNRKIIYQK